MPLTIGAFGAGTVISATTVRTKLAAVETYVNEQIANGDKSAAWVVPNHIFGSSFRGGSNPHSTLTSGESYYRQRTNDASDRSWWSSYLGQPATGWYRIPGLNATIQVPEDVSANGGHRVRVFGSVYAYEFGGVDGVMEEEGATCGAMSIGMLDSLGQAVSDITVCKGSSTSVNQAYAFYPRKQVSFLYDQAVDEGIYTFGLAISPFTPLSADLTKHCVIVQGNIIARYYCR